MNSFNPTKYDQEGYIIIAATPRTATQYIAHVFQAIEIDVQHEAFGSRGISAFQIVPHLSAIQHGFIIHQVRDPLKTISSMQIIDRSWPYIRSYTGYHPELQGTLQAIMSLWLRWNLYIEQYHHFRYRIEDIDSEWPRICELVNIPKIPLPDVSTNTHTRAKKYHPLSWHELEFVDKELTGHIRKAARRYGYNQLG